MKISIIFQDCWSQSTESLSYLYAIALSGWTKKKMCVEVVIFKYIFLYTSEVIQICKENNYVY